MSENFVNERQVQSLGIFQKECSNDWRVLLSNAASLKLSPLKPGLILRSPIL